MLAVRALARGGRPPPWREARRIAGEGPPLFAHPIGEQFVAQNAQPGKRSS